ncbi:proline dehydrogenase family protein [soil metagenome]
MAFGVRLSRSLLLAAAGSDALNALATRSRVVRRATRAFMPGERAEDAMDAGRGLAADGRSLIFTRLGEALASLDEAEAVRDHYLGFLETAADRGLPFQISVKPTQLGLDQSPEDCLRHAMELAGKAEAVGSGLWFDMEDSSYVDRTLELYEAVKARHPRTGIALQAYLRRTPDDLQRLRPLGPVVRLVKGAYAEPPDVAFPRKADTDAAFETLAGTMLGWAAEAQAGASPGCQPVFGTHDLVLIRRIIGRAEALNLERGSYEFHMLYGIGMRQQAGLRAQGHAVTTLISYGEAWYRWYMRRLAERPANVGFLLRSILG